MDCGRPRIGPVADDHHSQYDQYTIWTSTPTTYLSYYSTQVVTITEWIPCPTVIYTTYTTTTRCYNCPPQPCQWGCGPSSSPTTIPIIVGGGWTCAAKLCTNAGGTTETIALIAGEHADASSNGVTTQILAESCSFTVNPNFVQSGMTLPPCGGTTDGGAGVSTVSKSPLSLPDSSQGGRGCCLLTRDPRAV